MSKEELPKINNELNNSVIKEEQGKKMKDIFDKAMKDKKDPLEKRGDIVDKMMSGKKNKENNSNKTSSEEWLDRIDEFEKLRQEAEDEKDFRMVKHYEVAIDHANRMIVESLFSDGNRKEGREFLKGLVDYKKERIDSEIKNNKEKVELTNTNEEQKKKAETAGDNFKKEFEKAEENLDKELELLLPIAGGNGTESLKDDNKKEETDKVENSKIELESPQETISRLSEEHKKKEEDKKQEVDNEQSKNDEKLEKEEKFEENNQEKLANDEKIKKELDELSEQMRNIYQGIRIELPDSPKLRALEGEREKILNSLKEKIKALTPEHFLRQWVKGKDLEVINKYNKGEEDLRSEGIPFSSLETPEEKQKFYDAQSRKRDFINYFCDQLGLDASDAIKLYDGIAGEELQKIEKGRISADVFKKEKLGIEDPTAKKTLSNIAKGGLNTLGSIFGIRSIWESHKLYKDYVQKKEQRKDLSDLTLSLLEASQDRKIAFKNGKNLNKTEKENTILEKGPIALRIKELNAKLKEAKMPSEDKQAMRIELSKIFKEYRHAYKDLEEVKTEKTIPLLDLYINNSAQRMVVAREWINTVSIATFTPWLRTVGYTAFAGLERATKAGQSYDKKHFGEAKGWEKSFEKISAVAKNLTIDSARETFNGLTFNVFSKEKKGGFQKSADFAGSLFMLMRVAGIAEFEKQFMAGNVSMQEGAKKFWENFEKGDFKTTFEQGGVNMIDNAKRVLSYVGLAENPNEVMKKAMEAKAGGPKSKSLFEIIQEEGKGKKQEELGRQILEKTKGEYQEGLGKEIAEASKTEFITKIAIIRKGEGIEHVLIRQLENNPEGFGYKGDSHKFTEIHRWAQNKAHEIAIKNDFYDSVTGEESRVIFDAKNSQQYILNKDGSVESINRNTYGWKPRLETKMVLKEAQEMIQKSPEELMAESQRLQEETNEKIRILNYKTEYDLWGESDEKIKDRMRLEEMEKTMGMTEGNEKGMENPPELRKTPEPVEQSKSYEKSPFQQEEFEHRGKEMPPDLKEAPIIESELKESRVLEEEKIIKEMPKMTELEKEKMLETVNVPGEESPSLKMNELEKEKLKGMVNVPGETQSTKEEFGFREKFVTLNSSGFSEDEINKLNIDNLSREQIDKLVYERLEAPSDINLVNGFSYKGEDGNFNIHFNYDAKGNVVGYAFGGKPAFGGNLKLQDSVLKENWQETFNKKISFFNVKSLKRTEVLNNATEIGGIKKVLDSMKEKGLSDAKEYEFLVKKMNSRIFGLEDKYGDIFK